MINMFKSAGTAILLVAVAACDENGRPRSYTVCRVDSISGIDERRDFSDGLGRRWKVLEGGDGKTLKLEYVPGTTLIVF